MSDLLRLSLVIVHLTVAAIWLGSMSYSLTVVQPKVATFFPHAEDREPFLVLLAHGNRWKVVGLVVVLMVTGFAVAVISGGPVAVGYGAALLLYATAASIFWHVSWRHWPARVFALSEELPVFQRRLHMLATMMLALVAVAFLITLAVSVGAR